MKSGRIKCSECGANVTVSQGIYGGLARFVCENEICVNSEIAWKVSN